MSRTATLSNDELIGRLQAVFQLGGYEAASLSRLAGETGLAKAALYHRFPDGKEGMAKAVAKRGGEVFHALVLSHLEGDASPAEKLARMVEATNAAYDGGAQGCLVELLTLDGTPDGVRAVLAEGTGRWRDAIAKTLREAGLTEAIAEERAEDALVRIEGALIVGRALGNTGPFQRLMQRLVGELLSPVEASFQSKPELT